MPPDDLARLVHDLAALPRADRTSILAALTADERASIRSMMRGSPKLANPVPTDAPPEHSAWFMELLESNDATPAARAALADAVAAGRSAGASAARPPSRSLMQAAGRLLSQAGQRS